MSMLQPILFFKVMKWSINFKTFSVIILHKKYQTFIITGKEQAIGNQKTEIPIASSITIQTNSNNLSKEPFNEFENNQLGCTSFPSLFLLGKGLLQQGIIPKQAVRHMLFQHDCSSSHCLRLIFLLFDQMKTHEAARTVAARVKTITDSLTEFATWISDKSFIRKLKLARQSGKRIPMNYWVTLSIPQ